MHLQTYHPDYLLWNRPYHLALGVLLLAGFSLSLCGVLLKSFSFFPLAILLTLTPGIPLLIIYRRKFAEFKSHWAEEHPLASIQLTPAEAKKFWPIYDAYQRTVDVSNQRRALAIEAVIAKDESLSSLYARNLANELIANDEAYMGDLTNGPIGNVLGVAFLAVLVVGAVASVPLVVITGGGG